MQVQGDLMDSLNLLESLIKQLSCELDLYAGGEAGHAHQFWLGLGTSSSVQSVDDLVQCGGAMLSKPMTATSGSWMRRGDPAAGRVPTYRSNDSSYRPDPPSKVTSALAGAAE